MRRQSTCSEQQFEISDQELEYCNTNGIPLRTCTAEERLREILSFRSSPHLFHATCAITGNRVVTVVPPESGYTVYDARYEDELHAEQYARPYDFRRGFFEQLEELARAVPYFSRVGVLSANENSDFCQGISWSKNCYLCFRTLKGEDCLYCRYIRTGKDMIDCIWCVECELAYACSNITRCYDLAFSQHCQDCTCSRFLVDCVGCRDCFCCAGLRNAQYCFENKQLSADAYKAAIAQVDLSSRAECEVWRERLFTLKDGASQRTFLDRCEDCTGNYLVGCANAKNSYFSFDCVDVESCIGAEKLQSAYFAVGLGMQSELIYSCEAVGNQAYDVRFSTNCMSSVQNLEYCMNVGRGSTFCFGCVGLRRMSYSILNKQYSKAEYLETVERIKTQMREQGEYGNFLPNSLSPFSFNRSEAYDFLPLSEQRAVRYGFRWEQEEPLETAEASPMPDHLDGLGDDALSRRFRCQATGRLYSLQATELEFHRRMRFALSPFSPLERLYVRGNLLRINAAEM